MAETMKNENAGQTQPANPENKFDEKGHLPTTDVPTHPGVARGQIEDKGTPVQQTRNENAIPASTPIARTQVARAAKPTGTDVPYADDPPTIHPSEEVSEDQRPQNLARRQSQQKAAEHAASEVGQDEKNMMGTDTKEAPDYESIAQKAMENVRKDENLVQNQVNRPPQQEHRTLSGASDSSIPGSRSGNPLQNLAECCLGDRVHDIKSDGSHELKVQTRDKSRAISVTGDDPDLPDVPKLKVAFSFPGINPHVAQREFGIQVAKNTPAVFYLPPDVPNLEVLLEPNQLIHCELVHIDQDGRRGHPYITDFYTNPHVSPVPLEASAISHLIMESVLTKGEPKQEELKANPNQTRPSQAAVSDRR